MLKHPREITVAICDEIIGIHGEVLPSGLFHHVRVWTKCLGVVGLKFLNHGGISCLLKLGSPPEVAFGVAALYALHGIW